MLDFKCSLIDRKTPQLLTGFDLAVTYKQFSANKTKLKNDRNLNFQTLMQSVELITAYHWSIGFLRRGNLRGNCIEIFVKFCMLTNIFEYSSSESYKIFHAEILSLALIFSNLFWWILQKTVGFYKLTLEPKWRHVIEIFQVLRCSWRYFT